MADTEFLSIGGGLAGAALALELARNGREVVILEREHGPHHKVCGEFLSGEAQQLLAYLGVDIDALGASSVDTLRLASADRVATAPLPFIARGLSRYRLDDVLLKAAERAGAAVAYGSHVVGLDRDPDGHVAAVTSGGQRHRARFAALATGKHALRGVPRPPSDKVAFKIQLTAGAAAQQLLDRHVQLVAFDDGYVGSCLVEEEIITLCWVMRDRRLRQIGAGWPEQAAYLAGQSQLLRMVLTDAAALFDKPVAVAGIPYGFLRSDVVAPNILPVGDQLAVIPSYTGDGQAIALFSGVAAAQFLLAGKDAAAFQAEMMRRLRPQFRWATTVNLMFEHRFGQRAALAAAARLPGVVTRIAQSTRLKRFADVLEPGRR
jgi:flavin-dependent dehydrogenase